MSSSSPLLGRGGFRDLAKKRYGQSSTDSLTNTNGLSANMGVDSDPALEGELDRLSKSAIYIGIVFLLVSSPGLFNTWHTNAYVFIAAQQPHWCRISELSASNWTLDQQRNISAFYEKEDSIGACKYYPWDYANLTHYKFEEAYKFTQNQPRPEPVDCHDWNYEGEPTAVEEWNLVCYRLPFRSTVQTAVALGKFLGAFVFGFVADKWGRRSSCIISYVTYMLFGLLSYFSPDYWLFFVTRVALGMAGSGTFNTGFTLLTELCNVKHRAVLGLMYNMSYPLGMLTLSLIAYVTSNWRILQLCLVLPMFIMILHFIILPESPRWLLSQGRKEDAWKVVKNSNRFFCCCKHQEFATEFKSTEAEAPHTTQNENKDPANTVLDSSFMDRIKAKLARIVKLFSNREIVGRLLICWSLWFVTALTYYTLSLSSENFETDTHVYVAISGLVEAVSYLLPIPLLKYFGRRIVTGALFFISGISLLLILAVPRDVTIAVMLVAMVGRLCTGAVYSVVILYTAELFPTVNRSSAVGTSSTLSHLGGVSAAYIVDLLGAVAWFIPSTICGLLAFTAGSLSLLLPETKDKDLCDTVDQMMDNAKKGDKVTIKNCCACCI